MKKKKIEKNTDTPSLEQKNISSHFKRRSIKPKRKSHSKICNIKGSISLKGASIDDLTFKNYKVKLNEDKKVTLLGPRNIDEGYLVESGFVTTDKNIDIPNSDTVWSIVGNDQLTNNNSIKLSWTNKQGITYEKKYL